MTGAIAFRGRLPGLRCEPALPATTSGGSASTSPHSSASPNAGRWTIRSPWRTPTQYADVFGGDVALALDERGVPHYAALADAVGAFFANGGRRAYVVRVAGSAETLSVPARVIARRPLHAGTAVVGVQTGNATAVVPAHPGTAAAPLLDLDAATPGGWALRVAVDVDVVDTVLALAMTDDGTVALTAASRRLLDAGDAVLLWRAGAGTLLWTERAGDELAPTGGWLPGDVARLLRADLAVRRGGDGPSAVVEQFRDLRLGAGRNANGAYTPGWSDVLQPPSDRFHRDRSMFVRAPLSGCLLPILGTAELPIAADPLPADGAASGTVAGSPLQTGRYLPPPFTQAALTLEGLDTFDPIGLFLDASLRNHTLLGLRVELEALGLDDEAHAHGVHAVALQPEVAMVALPDLYHRPWELQNLPSDPPPSPPSVVPAAPRTGFGDCAVPPAVPEPAVPFAVGLQPRLVLRPSSSAQLAAIATVAAAVADLCAARADLIAVLGLPRRATPDDAAHLVTALATRPAVGIDPLSYIGLWHPWGAVLEPATPTLSPLRFVPPDGAVCGTIAAAELAAGVWIEPAGRGLATYVDVDDVEPTSVVGMFDRGLNVLRRTSGGISATSAHSLAADRALLQLSARRLLIWLRLLALREGTRLVFEPDDERFRAQVAAMFGRVLERVAHRRGARCLRSGRRTARHAAGE